MVWDDDSIKQLIKLWEKGLSTTEIAKKMNVSKNSVVGKVHRLCLKARPSPIKKKSDKTDDIENDIIEALPDTETKPENNTVERKRSKAENKSVAAEGKKKSTKKSAVSDETVEELVVKEEKTPAKAAKSNNKQAERIKLVDLDSHTCRWPLGDPRDEDFCFCGKKVRAGQTYCDEHSMVAYVKANSKR